MYIERDIVNGYNEYLSVDNGNDGNTMMDVGLLVLDEGESYTLYESRKETAALLLSGETVFTCGDQSVEAARKDCFYENPWCLHIPAGAAATIKARARSELYIQKTLNDMEFPAKIYRPEDTRVTKAGASGELLGCIYRHIRTIFDRDNAPSSNMVLGEVLNLPGKWSSYPPHHHPQPEVYFHRFDHLSGFGASFADGEIYASHHNGLTVVTNGFHSQTAAPGYAMLYVWGIRHFDGNPWLNTRIEDTEYLWLWEKDANTRVFDIEKLERKF